MTLADQIAALKFYYVNPNITEDNFSSQAVRGPVEIVKYDTSMSSEAVLADLEKKGLIPANLSELLEYAKTWDEKYPVVALGSSWVVSGGYRDVPYLDGWSDGRSLDLIVWAGDWPALCRFLALRKDALGPSDALRSGRFDPSAKKHIRELEKKNARLTTTLAKIHQLTRP
jgi:hypothetical protein